MKRIIILGATGSAGSYFTKYYTEYFDKDEYEIIAVGRRKTDVFNKTGTKYYSVDMTREEDLENLPKDDTHSVVLLAAQISLYMSRHKPSEYIKLNINGAFNVLEYCGKAKADRTLYTQTVFDISLYGTKNTVLKLDLPRNFSYTGDHAVYVMSKNTALELTRYYHEEYGAKSLISRLSTIYSYSLYRYYYPNGVKRLRPVYEMINRAKNSEPIELWGDPNYAKDTVHVHDFSQVLCKTIEANRDHGFHNIETGIPVTLKEQIESIIKVFPPKDNPSKIIYRPEKSSGGGSLMDVTSAKEELGCEPKYSCLKLFEDHKEEMEINRFIELREEKGNAR